MAATAAASAPPPAAPPAPSAPPPAPPVGPAGPPPLEPDPDPADPGVGGVGKGVCGPPAAWPGLVAPVVGLVTWSGVPPASGVVPFGSPLPWPACSPCCVLPELLLFFLSPPKSGW